MISRMTEIVGDMIAICSRPVVVSTSPVSRDRMPPVFMSHSLRQRQVQQPIEQAIAAATA